MYDLCPPTRPLRLHMKATLTLPLPQKPPPLLLLLLWLMRLLPDVMPQNSWLIHSPDIAPKGPLFSAWRWFPLVLNPNTPPTQLQAPTATMLLHSYRGLLHPPFLKPILHSWLPSKLKYDLQTGDNTSLHQSCYHLLSFTLSCPDTAYSSHYVIERKNCNSL